MFCSFNNHVTHGEILVGPDEAADEEIVHPPEGLRLLVGADLPGEREERRTLEVRVGDVHLVQPHLG